MVRVLTLFIVAIWLTPSSSMAAFQSVEDLMDVFVQSGFDYVVEFPRGDFSTGPGIKVLNLMQPRGVNNPQPLSALKNHLEVAIPELDYVLNNKAILSKAIHGSILAKAYQVADIFLCYREENKNSYRQCYLFPVQVSEVIATLKARKIIN